MEQKLIVVIMGQDCEKFLPMCLESANSADTVVYCDGGSTNQLRDWFYDRGYDKEIKWIEQKYNQDDKAMNGKQRNFYLNYLKENYPNDWALILDADEVVDDLSKIKAFIQTATPGLYSVHMRHFHNDLGHEDATVEKHWVMNRLFKISEASHYPEVEHPVLIGKHNEDKTIITKLGSTDCSTIWHLAHINHCFNIKSRYEKNIKHSNMHSPQYLEAWNEAHQLGRYPSKEVDPTEIPDVILKNFNINKDRYYFLNRNIELKNAFMVRQWNEHFKPTSVLDLGAGKGAYLHFWKWFVKDARGIEISPWAVNNAYCTDVHLGDVSESTLYKEKEDLITAVDILEHLDDKRLNQTLYLMAQHGKRFIFSIPFIGDPNLDKDKTHIQKMTKDGWKALIAKYGIQVSDAPKEWLYHNQTLIGEKNG